MGLVGGDITFIATFTNLPQTGLKQSPLESGATPPIENLNEFCTNPLRGSANTKLVGFSYFFFFIHIRFLLPQMVLKV